MAKWAARFALGLSNSVPGIRLKPANVKFEDDIGARHWLQGDFPGNDEACSVRLLQGPRKAPKRDADDRRLRVCEPRRDAAAV